MRSYNASLLSLAFSLVSVAQIGTSASLQNENVVAPGVVARQASGSTTASSLPGTAPYPTSSPTATTATISVATSIINQPLATITASSTKSKGNNGNTVSGTIGLACANCSTFGTLGFTGQEFSFENGAFTGGIVEMEANGFGGIFELNITSGQLKDAFSHNIFSFPVAGIGLPGVPGAQAGLLFEIAGSFSIELDDSMEFTVGGSFNVPDGSKIKFDVIDLRNSSQNGFSPSTGLQFAPAPFQANLSSPTLTASVGIQPKLTLGIHALDVSAEAGIFMDLPTISVEVARLTNVDTNCHAINGTNPGPAIAGNVTNVVPTAEIDVGLLADANALALKDGANTVLASTAFPLPTACLVFDAAAHTLGAASTLAAASTTSSSTSTPTAGSNSSGIIGAGAAAGSAGVHVWTMMGGLGLSVFFGMILL